MTKEEILELIDSTIQPNEQKGITASTLQNVLKEMAQSSGGGSDSGSDGVLYIKYPPLDGTELSEEDKAINAETFAKIKAGGNYAIYLNSEGQYFPVAWMFVEDATGSDALNIIVEGMLAELEGFSIESIDVYENGDMQKVMSIPTEWKYLTMDMLMQDFMSYLNYMYLTGGSYHFNLIATPHLGGSPLGDHAEIVTSDYSEFFVKVFNSKQTCLFSLDLTNLTYEIALILSGGTLYLDADDDLEKNNNKMILESLTDVGNVRFNCMTGVSMISGKAYNPVSIDQANHQVTIYNGAYVTYTINSDGTCTVQS